MTKLGTIAMMLAAAALALGCGSTSETTCDECGDGGCGDTDTDTDGDTDGDTDSDGDTDLECPDPIAESCPGDLEALVPPLLFEASEFGAGTRFVDVAPWSVLAERDVGTTRTISIIGCRGSDGWGIAPCDAASAIVASIDVPTDLGPRAVALAAFAYGGCPDLPQYLAVLCDDVSCALYGANLEADPPDVALAPVPGGALPPTSAVHGLWLAGEGQSVCAYGDGIHCFDGEAWTSPIPASPEDPLFNDMTTTFGESAGAIAVGDLGRYAVPGFPEWESSWGTAYLDRTAVASYADGWAIAQEDGILLIRVGEEWLYDCAFADEAVVELHALDEGGIEWSENKSIGVTASGRVFAARGPVTGMTDACYADLALGANPRAATFWCGIMANVFLADESAAYGTTDCAVD